MENTAETPEKTSAEAESFAEHKAIREGKSAEAAVKTPVVEKPEEKTSEQPEKGSESAEVSETSKDNQEKPKRDRSAEGRISELTAARKRIEEENAELRRKLEQLQAPKPAEAPKSEPPKAETKPATSSEDPEPKEEDFDDYAKFVRAAARWETRQEQRERDEQTRKATEESEKASVRESFGRKLDEARTKYDDFDQTTASDSAARTGLLLSPAMQQYAVEAEDGLDVIYHLGKNPEEYKRIAGLTPIRQIAELGKIAARLTGNTTPEKPKPPVSRAPAPPRTVGGIEPSAAKDTSQATSFAEHKRLRSRQ